ALHRHTPPARMLLEQGQCEAVQPGKILTYILLPNTRVVLAKGDIQTPVAAILNAPVTPHRTGKLLDAHRQATDVVAGLDRLLAVTLADGDYQPQRLQALPELAVGQGIRHRHLPVDATLV